VVLALLAVFALAWAVARALVQSIVGDEGLTYLFFVRPAWPAYWEPGANNHVLNSMGMRGLITLFGLHHLTVRGPALAGAAIYIASAYALCRMVSDDWKIRLPLFICLVYNPFVFDFFVAARGYGLASALLLAAITLAAWSLRSSPPRRVVRTCAAASAMIGLSFMANFSFAFADAAVMLMIAMWAMLGAPSLSRRILAASTAPGLAVAAILASYTLAHWPKGQLYEGATSIGEMLGTASEASLYRLNPMLVNPLLMAGFERIKPFLIPMVLMLAAARLAMSVRQWKSWELRLAAVAAGAIVLTVAGHWFAFREFGLLMPRHRTALFLVPLFSIAAGAAAAISPPSTAGKVARRGLILALAVLAGYFVLCLRLQYFKEWSYIAEAKQAYAVAAYYNHTRCVRNVSAAWYYDSALDFYRAYSGRERMSPFTNEHPAAPGKQLYVFNYAFERKLLDSLHLTLVYRGAWTDIAVGVTPEVADPQAKVCDASEDSRR
jgi:hypothetical protein